jgi:hypothetical protein
MDDGEQNQERADLIAQLFAMVTAKCEDAATIAVDCQGQKTSLDLLTGAEQITALAAETQTLAAAIAALLNPPVAAPPC